MSFGGEGDWLGDGWGEEMVAEEIFLGECKPLSGNKVGGVGGHWFGK